MNIQQKPWKPLPSKAFSDIFPKHIFNIHPPAHQATNLIRSGNQRLASSLINCRSSMRVKLLIKHLVQSPIDLRVYPS
ncbi:hypothetical protein [Chamaesiphon sp. GL140_3_metabinner_50]|uniref:hypothetical protein n=1 Tax=Chamaesiphon sp. GL140_3_metabinner_50 TaxID=2970812 RepID=UPI0025EB7C44|nr:hypothetical protein [Chamaesiphon sp. GL140_3_metabinner_50]